MPIFLDRHDMVEQTAEETAQLHIKDLEIQDQYGVKFMGIIRNASRPLMHGDLGYTIFVSGNAFVQTRGDERVVTGVFLGRAHEGVGGTLERTDLTTAFGGVRE